MQNGLNELSDEEFENQLKESGFGLQEYKHQLGRLMATENVKRAEISEKIVVSTQEVEEYYKKHPEYTKEAYHIAIASVPEEEYEANPDTIASDSKLAWEDHGFIETAELNTDYLGVKNLQPGELMEPLHKDNSYELVKLIAKQDVHLKPLEKRYDSIERTIQNKRKDKIVKNLEKNLRQKATIVYLD
jgi:parvulin-like peptidyl-prolyl isomerase